MDDEDKKYRQGPPSEGELKDIKTFIRRKLSDTIVGINQTLSNCGVRMDRDGSVYPYCVKGEFTIFRDPLYEQAERMLIKHKGLDALILKGAKGLKAELDKYVIGQDNAKKVLAVEIINHYRKIASEGTDGGLKRKKRNILLIGNTGVGKTYLIERIAEQLGVPFAKVTATDYTTAGYVGGDVDDIIRQNLLRNAKGDVNRAEKGIVYIDEIDKISASTSGIGPDIGGDKVQSAILTLIDGKEVEVVGPNDRAGKNELKGRRLRGEVKETINTERILFILGGSFSAGKGGKSLLECVKERKLKETAEKSVGSIGFLADLNKKKATEGSKDVEVRSEDLVSYGMRHEMIGRIPARAMLQDLSVEDLYSILKKDTEDSLVNQYTNEFKDIGILLEFKDDALRAIAEKSDLKLGARGLETVMSDILGEYRFELEGRGKDNLTVTKKMVEDPQTELKQLLRQLDIEKEEQKTELNAVAQ